MLAVTIGLHADTVAMGLGVSVAIAAAVTVEVTVFVCVVSSMVGVLPGILQASAAREIKMTDNRTGAFFASIGSSFVRINSYIIDQNCLIVTPPFLPEFNQHNYMYATQTSVFAITQSNLVFRRPVSKFLSRVSWFEYHMPLIYSINHARMWH